VSAAQGKRKERVGRRAAVGGFDGPVGRPSWIEGKVFFPFFFLKLFSKSNLFNSNSFKIFQIFSQNFINSLNLTQAIKNHA
jgi:hypothetical protein